MSIGAVGSSASYDVTQMASTLVSNFDKNKDESVDKSEFVKGMTANGISSDDANAMFDELDSAKTGKLTQSTFESALSNSSPSSATPSTTTTISSDAVEKLASESSTSTSVSSSSSSSSSSATSTSSSSTKTYEKADSNEDGTVTSQEQTVYDVKHPKAESNDPARPRMPAQIVGGMVDETA